MQSLLIFYKYLSFDKCNQKLLLSDLLAVQRGKGLLVVLVKRFEHFEVPVVDRFVFRVRNVGLVGRDEVFDLVDRFDDSETDAHDGGGTDRANVLRRTDGLDLPAGDVREDLTGDRRQRASADEADGVRGLDVLGLLFQHPALVVADTFYDRTDEFPLARLEFDVKEHAGGIRVLEGTAVAVEPGREDDAVGAGGHRTHDLGQVVIEARIGGFEALFLLCNIVFIEVDVHFVEGEVILTHSTHLAAVSISAK